MAVELIKSEIAQLLKKYEDEHSPLDILHILAEAAKLGEANVLLKERLKKDVYELFGKDDEGVLESVSGRELLHRASVHKLNVARTCSVFQTDAEVRFESSASEPDGTNESAKGNKRKASKVKDSSSTLTELVTMKYHYSEQVVGSSSGTASTKDFREKGISVMEAPYKSINLIISISRGEGGLDAQTLLDFQLLTAGCRPSANQVCIQDTMGDGEEEDEEGEGEEEGESDDEGSVEEVEMASEDGEGDSDGDNSDHSADGNSDGDSQGEGDSQGDSQNGPEEDTSDYYTVNVSHDALRLLKSWLGFRSLEEQRASIEQAELAERAAKRAKGSNGNGKQKGGKKVAEVATAEPSEAEDSAESDGDSVDGSEGAEEGSPYEGDPALGDLLQFVLSLPYVDEAWGIHDLILNQELGNPNGDEEGSEDGSDDGSEMNYCLPCGYRG